MHRILRLFPAIIGLSAINAFTIPALSHDVTWGADVTQKGCPAKLLP